MSTTATICSRYPIGDEAKALLREDQSPREFLDALRDAGLRIDALRLVAHVFPRRSAVWWGVLCLERWTEPQTPAAQKALESARNWVLQPDDNHRRAAMPAVELAGLDSPAGSLSAATYFSGGSVAPPELPPSPPPEHVTAELVFASLVAAGSSEPEQAEDRFDAFLDLAVELTEGKHLWPGAKPAG